MKNNTLKKIRYLVVPVAVIVCILIILSVSINHSQDRIRKDYEVMFAQHSQSEKEKSAALFGEVAKVLKHQRCLNCHPSDDYPRQGDDMHRHLLNVQRGPDDRGMVGMRCISCHGPENNRISGVPGAPEPDDPTKSRWHLAPLSMAWMGLTDRELGERLLDTEMNGGMSPDDLVEHMENDPLVLWAWDPGEGREPIPIPHEEFIQNLKEWIETGAHLPDEKQ